MFLNLVLSFQVIDEPYFSLIIDFILNLNYS